MKNLGNKLKDIGKRHQVKINKVFTTYNRFQDRIYARHIKNGTFSSLVNDGNIENNCLKYAERYSRLYGRCK